MAMLSSTVACVWCVGVVIYVVIVVLRGGICAYLGRVYLGLSHIVRN